MLRELSITALPLRLSSKIQIDNVTGCWLWTASRGWSGYGHVRMNGELLQSHRVIYELLVGKIPKGFVVDHLCRCRRCVNPNHLEPVTEKENILRGNNACARNARLTHCPCGAELVKSTFPSERGERGCPKCKKARRNLASVRLMAKRELAFMITESLKEYHARKCAVPKSVESDRVVQQKRTLVS